MGGARVLLLLLLIGWGKVMCINWNPIPRKTIKHSDVCDSVARFRAAGAIFALDPSDISRQLRPQIDWAAPQEKKKECVTKGKNNQTECFNYIRFLQTYNHTHLYTCGTYAFQPTCTYINADRFTLDSAALEDGKGKCPYDPAKGHIGLLVDKELYSATVNNFLGTEPVILRNLGPHHSLKSESSIWLKEPDFVGSALVPESSGSREGDDDKIYFFFSEHAEELACDSEVTVARVARVCKKKWTTFQKARLVCSLPERHVTFNNLRAVFTLPGPDWRSTAFYGIFHAQWGDVDVSVVCRYHIGEVKNVFDGPYMEYREASQRWDRYTGPCPAPARCITNWHRENGFNSSLQLPDSTLNFAKKHPLMERAATRPLLLTKGINFTRLAVDRVIALDQKPYSVLFVGTAEGWLQRAVVLDSEAHVIEEIQLFDHPQPVDSLTISHSKKFLYVGSRSERGRVCIRIDLHRGSTSTLTQDLALDRFIHKAKFDKPVFIPSSDPSRPKNVTVVVGSDLVLPCHLVSNLAQPSWLLNERELPLGGGEGGATEPRFDRALRALVIPNAGPQQAGATPATPRSRA
ncbi:hypothetical protein ANANG_G00189070 [Anguilla anguilla]|uniref:Sema domain-containing protein n=1 Tax=Anguilla anguilla TaxID=7936 RepID=A0A9D3RV03_ANGAN|nr:hypothetical protein ANANG_G00189070 [Anguilla anguilla]